MTKSVQKIISTGVLATVLIGCFASCDSDDSADVSKNSVSDVESVVSESVSSDEKTESVEIDGMKIYPNEENIPSAYSFVDKSNLNDFYENDENPPEELYWNEYDDGSENKFYYFSQTKRLCNVTTAKNGKTEPDEAKYTLDFAEYKAKADSIFRELTGDAEKFTYNLCEFKEGLIFQYAMSINGIYACDYIGVILDFDGSFVAYNRPYSEYTEIAKAPEISKDEVNRILCENEEDFKNGKYSVDDIAGYIHLNTCRGVTVVGVMVFTDKENRRVDHVYNVLLSNAE